MQLHLDLTVATVDELAEQHDARARAGRRRSCSTAPTTRTSRSTCFADPEGHPFCIFVA